MEKKLLVSIAVALTAVLILAQIGETWSPVTVEVDRAEAVFWYGDPMPPVRPGYVPPRDSPYVVVITVSLEDQSGKPIQNAEVTVLVGRDNQPLATYYKIKKTTDSLGKAEIVFFMSYDHEEWDSVAGYWRVEAFYGRHRAEPALFLVKAYVKVTGVETNAKYYSSGDFYEAEGYFYVKCRIHEMSPYRHPVTAPLHVQFLDYSGNLISEYTIRPNRDGYFTINATASKSDFYIIKVTDIDSYAWIPTSKPLAFFYVYIDVYGNASPPQPVKHYSCTKCNRTEVTVAEEEEEIDYWKIVSFYVFLLLGIAVAAIALGLYFFFTWKEEIGRLFRSTKK